MHALVPGLLRRVCGPSAALSRAARSGGVQLRLEQHLSSMSAVLEDAASRRSLRLEAARDEDEQRDSAWSATPRAPMPATSRQRRRHTGADARQGAGFGSQAEQRSLLYDAELVRRDAVSAVASLRESPGSSPRRTTSRSGRTRSNNIASGRAPTRGGGRARRRARAVRRRGRTRFRPRAARPAS